MSQLEVAAIQFSPELEPQDNLERARAWVSKATQSGAELVVFPEYTSSFTPRLDDRVVSRAQNVTGSFTSGMREIAREFQCTLVFGLVERVTHPDKFANTVLAVDSAGEVVAKYQKAHLYDAFGQRESDRVIAGALSKPPVFALNGITIGIQTCYDLRFPELTRWLVDAGAEAIVVPAEWVAGPNKVHHWTTLLAARAIENTAYVIAADHPEPVGVGHSGVVDPRGLPVQILTAGEGMARGTLDSEVVQTVREENPSLALRRFRVEPIPRAKTQ